MSSIKLRFKYTPPGAPLELRYRRIYVGISLSESLSAQQPILRRLTQWAASTKAEVTFVIGDFFFRRNLEAIDGIQSEIALERASMMGAEFANIIVDESRECGLNSTMRFASEVCQGKGFHKRVDRLSGLLEGNLAFQRWIDLGASLFVKRSPHLHTNSINARQHSRMYQIEEIAMFESLAADGWNVNAYWGSHLPVMVELVDGELRGLSPDLDQLTLISISRRS